MRENKGELGMHGAWFDIGLGELHVFDNASNAWAVI
jgi:carbonic anhydrase